MLFLCYTDGMKKGLILLSFFLTTSFHSFALSCINLQKDLKQGAETTEVFALQTFLLQKGFLSVVPNGYFGPSTLAAVRRYQDSIAMPDNGVVTFPIRQAISKETCGQDVVVAPTSIVTPAPIVSSSTTGLAKSYCLDLKQDLLRGRENTSVLALQNFLMRRGLLMVAPNGYFGPSTIASVKLYQEDVGLSRSGDVKSLTRAAIKNETCSQ